MVTFETPGATARRSMPTEGTREARIASGLEISMLEIREKMKRVCFCPTQRDRGPAQAEALTIMAAAATIQRAVRCMYSLLGWSRPLPELSHFASTSFLPGKIWNRQADR